jgi:endogenous inhibitor of DNA gyrase (YacG/DUF329 family)
MKNILESIIFNDTSYNKSATRYLYKTHPELWANILKITCFLPKNAKPKQRVWHILNEKYEIQICPVTGDPLRWNEKDYRKFCSVKVKNTAIGSIISNSTKNNHWRQKDPDKSKKANDKFSKGFSDGKHKPWEDRNRDYKASLAAARKTWMKKYGVDNPSKSPSIRQKLVSAALNRYSLIDRPLALNYYNQVRLETNKSWYNNFYRINGEGPNKRSKDVHLDHIYSISEGFRNNVPPEIIGHWTNLRLISKIENSSKGTKCHKTLEQLYEDYIKNGNISN